MPENSSMRKRHCWACLKKRVVCDFARPSCSRCQKAGIECPGYDERKPLKWVEPGKVTSKSQRKRPNQALAEPASVGERCTCLTIEQRKENDAKAKTSALQKRVTDTMADEKDMHAFKVELIPRFGLKDETTEIVQATYFYNSRMFPVMLDYYRMAPSPYIISVPLKALRQVPVSIAHSVVSFAIGWRMHRQELPEMEVWPKLYHHRGLAIRDLNERISSCELEKTVTGRGRNSMIDSTIISILVFLCAELQQCASMNWLYHTDAMTRLIKLRGGLTDLWYESPGMRPSLIFFIVIRTFAGATSPVSDLVSITPYLELLDSLDSIYDDVFPFCLCPLPLFREIIFINHLRLQAATGAVAAVAGEPKALELLLRIDAFSPEQWAKTRNNFIEEFTLVGVIYQSAVMLYCILSLQDIPLLHASPELRTMRALYGDRLFNALEQGLPWPQVKFFMVWPVVVAGVEAAERGLAERNWIDEQLADMSRELGTRPSLVARAMLRRFWASERTRWEDCFTQPYAFTF